MNWLDLLVAVVVSWAALKGFLRGFIVELASLVAMVLGVWAGFHLGQGVATTLGLDPGNTAIAFLVTFVLVVVAVHLLARGLTALVDVAQLGLPNKLAGAVLAVLRSAVLLSIALTFGMKWSAGALPSAEVRERSWSYAPLSGIAPMVLPFLEDTQWLKEVKDGSQEVLRHDFP